MTISFTLNGEPVSSDAPPDTLLVDMLRERGLTGTKQACGVGVCGVCTVVVNELPASSCLYLLGCAEGADIWTVEGLAQRDERLIEAFIRHEGFQCGICTPGQVASAYTLRREMPHADEDAIREYMAGNLCRCTGYASIVAAVKEYLDDA